MNKELARVHKLEARTANSDAAWRALALRRAAQFAPYPAAGDTAGEGMRPLPSQRRRTSVPPGKIGRVSQATKVRAGHTRRRGADQTLLRAAARTEASSHPRGSTLPEPAVKRRSREPP